MWRYHWTTIVLIDDLKAVQPVERCWKPVSILRPAEVQDVVLKDDVFDYDLPFVAGYLESFE